MTQVFLTLIVRPYCCVIFSKLLMNFSRSSNVLHNTRRSSAYISVRRSKLTYFSQVPWKKSLLPCENLTPVTLASSSTFLMMKSNSMLNSTGDGTPPCITPVSISKLSDSSPYTLTWALEFWWTSFSMHTVFFS